MRCRSDAKGGYRGGRLYRPGSGAQIAAKGAKVPAEGKEYRSFLTDTGGWLLRRGDLQPQDRLPCYLLQSIQGPNKLWYDRIYRVWPADVFGPYPWGIATWTLRLGPGLRVHAQDVARVAIATLVFQRNNVMWFDHEPALHRHIPATPLLALDKPIIQQKPTTTDARCFF